LANLNDTLAERNKTHGDFATHAAISQKLKAILRDSPKWDLLTPVQKESLEMQVHKQARIVNGDPNHLDSWHDIGGYAKLVEDELSHGEFVEEPIAKAVSGPLGSPLSPLPPVPSALPSIPSRQSVAPPSAPPATPVTPPTAQPEPASVVGPPQPAGGPISAPRK
jgi:hypothetical protein